VAEGNRELWGRDARRQADDENIVTKEGGFAKGGGISLELKVCETDTIHQYQCNDHSSGGRAVGERIWRKSALCRGGKKGAAQPEKFN